MVLLLFRGTDKSLEYLQKVCRKLHANDFCTHYLLGPRRQSGRPITLFLGKRQLVAQMGMDMKSVWPSFEKILQCFITVICSIAAVDQQF